MEQTSQQQSDNSDQKLVELQGKLEQANQVIANLQQQNLALKKQSKQNSQSTVVVNSKNKPTPRVSNPENNASNTNPQPNKKQITQQKTNLINKLPHLHFYGLVILVVCLIVGIFQISSLIAQNKQEQKQKAVNNFANTPSVKAPSQASSPPSAKPSTTPTLKVTNVPVAVPANPPVVPQSTTVSQPVTFANSTVNLDSVYNVGISPQFQPSAKLQAIVDELVKQAKSQNLSTENLSITLIDLNHNTIAGYKQQTPRFPASVAKLFWLVILQAKIQSGSIHQDVAINNEMNQMIVQSDNDAASKILDRITGAPTSVTKLAKSEYSVWKAKRDNLNTFFTNAGYENINISQKTFPIPKHYSVNIPEPQGSDLQIRGENPKKPIRNKVTSFSAARLMYEIVTGQAISPQSSDVMKNLLHRDLLFWQNKPLNPEEFHPVKNFLGESLPAHQVEFISKAGWTTNSREEVAYVGTRDGKVRYVIAVFGDDASFAKSLDIFPQLSFMVFQRMSK